MWTPNKDILNVIRLESWPVFKKLPAALLIRSTHVAVKQYGESQQITHALLHTVDARTYLIGDSRQLGLWWGCVTVPHEVKVLRGVPLQQAAFAPSMDDPFLTVLSEGHVWCTNGVGEFHKVIEMPSNVASVACRAKAVVALTSGCVHEMLRSGRHVKQIYDGTAEPAISIACGENHSVLLTVNGRLYIWGSDSCGQMGKGTRGMHLAAPTPILTDTMIKMVTCGSYTTAVVTRHRRVLCWGANDKGSAGTGQHGDVVTAPNAVALDNQAIIAIKSVRDTTVAVSEKGETFVWGDHRAAWARSGPTVTDNRRCFPTDLLASDTCVDTGGLVTIDPGSIYLLVWQDPKVFTSLKDELMAALTRAVSGEEPKSPRRKRPISAEARDNSTEEPTSLEEMGQISGEPTTPEDSRENTNEENAEHAAEEDAGEEGKPADGTQKKRRGGSWKRKYDRLSFEKAACQEDLDVVSKENSRLRLYNAELNDLILANTDEMTKKEKDLVEEIEKLRRENETLRQTQSEGGQKGEPSSSCLLTPPEDEPERASPLLTRKNNVTSPGSPGTKPKLGKTKPLPPIPSPKQKGDFPSVPPKPKPEVAAKLIRDNSTETELEQLRAENSSLIKELREAKEQLKTRSQITPETKPEPALPHEHSVDSTGVDELRKERDDLKKALQEATKECSVKTKEVEQLRTEKTSLQKTVDEANAESSRMIKEQEVLRAERDSLKKTVDKAATGSPQLKPKPAVRAKPVKRDSSTRHSADRTKVDQLHNEKDDLRKALHEATEECTTKNDELEKLSAERDAFKKAVDETHAERSAMAKEQVQLRAERDSLKKAVDKATKDLEHKEELAQEEIKQVHRNWQFTYDTAREETERLMEANEKLQKYIQSNLAGVASLDENMNVSDTLQQVLGDKETLEKDIELLKKELADKADLLKSAAQEKTEFEKCLIEARSEVQVKSESYQLILKENAYLKQRLETVIREMLDKIEGAQADILIKLRTEVEDSNKGMRIEIAQLRQSNEHMQMYISVAKKGVISFSVLHYVAQNITGDWYMLGRELDLEDSTLTHINHDIRGLKDKAFKVLMTWYERAPEATTKDKLVDALRELRRKDIADDIADME